MKVIPFLVCTSALLITTNAKAVEAPLDLISLEDLTPEDRKQLEILNHQASRSKRSGSGDILSHLKTAIAHGIARKVSQFAKSSASASAKFSSGSSGGSSGGHDSYDHHHVPESYDHKSFDWWALKKSILNTLLQAVKAIKGGVIAIKGQLLKGSGYLISAKGKLLAQKGDQVTELGKHIASSAILSPTHTGSSGHGEISHEYGPPISAHYGPPPTLHYGAPHDSSGAFSSSGPANPYVHQKYSSNFDDSVAHGAETGIVILKKIPPGQRDHLKAQASAAVPDFKPIKSAADSEYSVPSIIGKFLSASSSLQPDVPKTEPEATNNVHYKTPPNKDYQPPEKEVEQSDQPPIHAQELYNSLINQKPNTFVTPEFSSPPKDTPAFTSPQKDDEPPKPEHEYFKEYEGVFKLDVPDVSKLKLQSYNKQPNGNIQTKPEDLPIMESFPPYSGTEFLTNTQTQNFDLSSFPSYLNLPPQQLNENLYYDTNTIPSSNIKGPISNVVKVPHNKPPHRQPTRIIHSPQPSFVRHPHPPMLDVPPGPKMPTKNRHHTRQVMRHKNKPFDVVQSVTYELGPNGPVKLN